jgi:hypothetical protein
MLTSGLVPMIIGVGAPIWRKAMLMYGLYKYAYDLADIFVARAERNQY